MTLRDWLDTTGRDSTWLANELQVSSRTVDRWIYGDSRPRDALHIVHIERLSEGKVTAVDVALRPAPRRPRGPRPGFRNRAA